jgi:hypothetical protein
VAPVRSLCTPLIRADRLEAGAHGLLAARRRVPAVVAMRSVAGDGPVERALMSAGAQLGRRSAWERRVARAAARPLDDAARPRRRDLERKRHRLQETLDAQLTIENRAGSDAAVQEFLALEAAGWKGRAGTALASSRQPPARSGFLRRDGDCLRVERFHADGRLRLYDSCSDPDSKLVNQLFGDRRTIVSSVTTRRRLARPVRVGVQAGLALHRRIQAGS